MGLGIEEAFDEERTPVQAREDEELRPFVHCTTRHITTKAGWIYHSQLEYQPR